MLFNSWSFVFLVFFTLILFYNKRMFKYQTYILIVSSFIFYAYGQPYLLGLLFISASINAIVSYVVYFENRSKKKKIYAVGAVLFNILVLSFFKYSIFFSRVVEDFRMIDSAGDFLILIPLPIGISFYTFQGISLVVDLYRSHHKSECPVFEIEKDFKKHYMNTLFFISFFPQLVAGPIVKAYQFYPQINKKFFSEIDFVGVVKILILGYFFKMVIADNLKDQTFWMTYPHFETLSSLTLVVLLIGYSIQIFSDFAGYSFIAIGIAKLFGYHLPENFNFPYIAKSFSEFWTRWHISLSSWLKEYLYFALGGNRKGHIRTYINLMIVMVLGGLWHGAAWSYMAWGIYHGVLLTLERIIGSYYKMSKNRFLDTIRVFFVFGFITLGWIFFKMEFKDAFEYVKAIMNNMSLEHNKFLIMNIFFFSIPVFFYYVQYVYVDQLKSIKEKCQPYIYALMLFGIVFQSGSPGAFIYFQF